MIEKIIHFMWLDNDKNYNTIPSKYDKYINTFIKHNPDFEIKYWFNNNTEQFLKDNFDKDMNLFFHNLEKVINKCDFARFAVMYIYGGIYSDLDFVCRKNLSTLIEDNDRVFTKEVPEHEHNNILQLCNGFFASHKQDPFIMGWMQYMMKTYNKDKDVLKNTGPIAFYKYYSQSEYNFDIKSNICNILPYTDKGEISSICTTFFDPYVYTYWNDGGTETNDSKNKKIISLTIKGYTLILTLIVIYIFIIFLLIYFLKIKKYLYFSVSILTFVMIGLIIVTFFSFKKESHIINENQRSGLKLSSNLIYDDVINSTIPLSKTNNKRYKCYNPSVTNINYEIYIMIRKSSYFLCPGNENFDNSGNSNRHILGKLDTQSNDIILDTTKMFFFPKDINILEKSPYSKIFKNKCIYYGVEDVRIIYNDYTKKLIGIGNMPICSKNKSLNSMNVPYYVELELKDKEDWEVSFETILYSDFQSMTSRQKNYMPIIKEGELYLICSLEPYILVHANTSSGMLKKIIEQKLKNKPFKTHNNLIIHGGSQAIKINNYYIGIAHVTAYSPYKKYYHFFYLLDEDLNLLKFSELFCLDSDMNNCPNIQFAMGIAKKNDKIIVSFGEYDCYSRIIEYNTNELFKKYFDIII
jgi:mannosyltransferase OCH1-like enzyme/predicted GH43/DUF377 family glycosyl hydrolase